MSAVLLGRLRRELLTMLAGAGPGGLASRNMISAATRSGPVHERQSEVNVALCSMLPLGLVTRTRRTQGRGGGYQWRITAEGTAAAATPSKRAARAASKARNERRRQAADAALGAARGLGSGPGTPLSERRPMCVNLRAAGCTLQQIGDLFGVTRETVRQSLARAGEP